MKKLLSILLVMVMILAMSVPAYAATGSITVENPTVGEKYAGYRIFDATYAGDAVSYTIKSDSPWFASVNNETDSPFTLEQIGNTGIYNVSYTSTEGAAALDWIKAQFAKLTDKTPQLTEITAVTDVPVKWDNVTHGYYLITSELGAVVTVTNLNANVTIIDKNQKPGWEKPTNPPYDPTDPPKDPITDEPIAPPIDPETGEPFIPIPQDGKNVSAEGVWYGPTSTASIGDKLYFKFNAFVPEYNGDKQVYEYKFTDTLHDTIEYNDDLTMKINGNLVNSANYEVTEVGQVITITLQVHEITDYPTEASMEVNYTATVKADAVYDNKNTVEMDWTEYEPGKTPGTSNPGGGTYPPAEPNVDDVPDSTTHTYVYGFNLQKYEGFATDNKPLDGAKFELYDALTGGNKIDVVLENGKYRVSSSGAGAVIEAGHADIFGLAAGTYYLEETEAPAGYNKLTARQKVEISGSAANDVTGYLSSDVEVENFTGVILPETGGIGTTIFYVIGGLLMTGAAVLMVTKKKMSAKEN